MKKINLILLLTIVTGFCYGQKLKMTVNNKSGFDLDSVVVGNKQIGFMKKDTSVIVYDCNCLTHQDGIFIDFGKGTGKINNTGNQCRYVDMNHCGTGRERITEGIFDVDIIYREGENCYNLIFWPKEKK